MDELSLIRRYGFFSCDMCGKEWESAHVYVIYGSRKVYYRQICSNCGTGNFPKHHEAVKCPRCGRRRNCICAFVDDDDMVRHVDVSKPHRSDLCAKCIAGHPCVEEEDEEEEEEAGNEEFFNTNGARCFIVRDQQNDGGSDDVEMEEDQGCHEEDGEEEEDQGCYATTYSESCYEEDGDEEEDQGCYATNHSESCYEEDAEEEGDQGCYEVTYSGSCYDGDGEEDESGVADSDYSSMDHFEDYVIEVDNNYAAADGQIKDEKDETGYGCAFCCGDNNDDENEDVSGVPHYKCEWCGYKKSSGTPMYQVQKWNSQQVLSV